MGQSHCYCPKPDGNIRICSDYKRTVNPYIEADQYPLPTAEELFTKMKGGKTFTKLYLKTAYLQIELDPDCRKFPVVNSFLDQGLFLEMWGGWMLSSGGRRCLLKGPHLIPSLKFRLPYLINVHQSINPFLLKSRGMKYCPSGKTPTY